MAATATPHPSPSPGETAVSSTVKIAPRISGEPSVRAIIAAARRPQPAAARGAWLLAGASAALWYLCFFPVNWGPLAFLAPVPLLLLARLDERPRRTYLAVYVTQLAGFLAVIFWMAANGPMVPAYLALSCYLALYGPAFLLATRTAVHRLNVPLVVAAPVVLAGLELLRAHLMTGFAWYFLGHTQWRWTWLIQICDLVGVYGVSFVVAACAAAAAVCVPDGVFAKLRLLPVRDGVTAAPPAASFRAKAGSVAFALTLLAAALGYGYVRTSGDHFKPGPRVALIQSSFPSDLGAGPSPGEVFTKNHLLTREAVRYQPDFVIWPESAYRWPLLETAGDVSDDTVAAAAGRVSGGRMSAEEWRRSGRDMREVLHDLATQANAGLLVGLSAYVVEADRGLRRYNSAAFARPELGLVGRYDKRHRVVFGEYVPLRDVFPFLAAATPYTADFGIEAGAGPVALEHAGYRVGPLVCYEDTVPQLVRADVAAAAAAGKPIDVLADVSNDGWFDRSPEQEQHLVTSLFRAVETRTPLVRAANTGVSAAIDGDGRLVEPVAFLHGETHEPLPLKTGGRFTRDVPAVMVADVPLDTRTSLYVRGGDWFGGSCAAAAVFCLFWPAVRRRAG